MDNLLRVSTLFVCLVAVPFMATAQEQGKATGEVVRALQAGTAAERAEAIKAVHRLGATPPPSVVSAVAEELLRMNAVVANRRNGLGARQGGEWDTANIGDYYGDLVQAAAALRGSEEMLPPLLGAIHTGRMVSEAVASYGQPALAKVLQLFQDRSAEALHRAGAARTIELMSRDGRLDSIGRRDVATAVSSVLARPEPFAVVGGAIDLAWATGDLALMGKVQEVANDPAVARLDGRDDARSRKYLQERAKRAVAGKFVR